MQSICLLSLCFFLLTWFCFAAVGQLEEEEEEGETTTLVRDYFFFESESTCHVNDERGSDRRTDKTVLQVLEFNVEWLFLNRSGTNIKCPGDCSWRTGKSAWLHLQRIAEFLDRINADLIHFNEVESEFVLQQLIHAMPVHGKHYRAYLIPGTDTTTGQNVGMITKVDPVGPSLQRFSHPAVSYPVAESTCPASKGARPGEKEAMSASGKPGGKAISASKHYFTRFKIPLAPRPTAEGQSQRERASESGHLEFLLCGIHLLAFPSMVNRCQKREAQAKFIQLGIQHELRTVLQRPIEVMILGDCNDMDPLVVSAAKDKPLSNVLSILRNTSQLANVASFVHDKSRIYSSWYDKNHNCKDDGGFEHSLIDHILVSQGLWSRLKTVEFLHDYPVSCQDRISDHWPLRAVFDMTFHSLTHASYDLFMNDV